MIFDFWPTIILFTSPLHATEDILFVRDANLLKAKSLRCLFTRQVTTNWTWKQLGQKKTPSKTWSISLQPFRKRKQGPTDQESSRRTKWNSEVFTIRTSTKFSEVNPERPIHTTAVMVMRENREAGILSLQLTAHNH